MNRSTRQPETFECFGKLRDDDGSFDREFWRKVSDQDKFAAAWQMVVDYYRIKGWNRRELRFSRHLATIECRER